MNSPSDMAAASFLTHRISDFVVSGGQFTNVTNIHNAAPVVRRGDSSPTLRYELTHSADFRMIPLGDLDLVGGGVVSRRKSGYTKRVYPARIDGRNSKMTAVMFEGPAAGEAWGRELAQYATFRHPNLVQVYAAASSNGLYATVFQRHDNFSSNQK
ncbi:hypothetical protein B0H16DRAFT_1601428 [Mycena metata]|uniref:Protein kinase domain-containing protein n=1 Tax=Mycena metata TaxID=1033252 RepID=A0AAD7HKC8_9AGAR|nr:hypothetical protein B0H16DRAFT_1601428 [Mycena metata]